MRKVVTIFLFLFFVPFVVADAASVITKTSNAFGEPRQYDGKIRIDLKGVTVKYLRHTKYSSKTQNDPVQTAQMRGSNIVGFAYNCPGYYLTRAYADAAGTNLIGYIRVQVVTADVTTKGCPAVSVAKPATPPAIINKTHPIPEVDEHKNMAQTKDNGWDEWVDPNWTPPKDDTPKSDPYKDPQYLTANEKCALNNTMGAGDYQIRYKATNTPTEGGHVSGPYCVDMSNCMYTDHWYCTASDTPPRVISDDDNATGVPHRDQYNEMDYVEDFGACGIGDTIDNRSVTTPCKASTVADGSPPEDEGTGGEEGGEEEGCGLCDIFECPGWDAYLSTLYSVAAFAVGDVEPPPVPDLPKPNPPNIFNILKYVDERNPAKPTGQDGMGNTPFEANDVKNNAPDIPVRDDPTGGFNIIDPLTTLPKDGSTAPKPTEQLESIPYPGGSDGGKEVVPKPNNNKDHSTKVPIPSNPGGSAKYPDDPGGSAKYPTP